MALSERFKESEMAFYGQFQAMIARRMSCEERLRKMEAKPPKELADYLKALEREEEPDAERNEVGRELILAGPLTKETFFGSQTVDVLHGLATSEDKERLDNAALKIQAAARRWLIRKRDRKPAVWSRNLLRTTLTEAKAAGYRDKVELWQQRNKVAPMTPQELQALHQKAQGEYAKFSARLNKSRLEDHKALALLAQSDTALAVLECAPSLREYSTSEWSQFHSLPLHVAIKGRMEHKAAMRRMDQDRWKRILGDYG